MPQYPPLCARAPTEKAPSKGRLSPHKISPDYTLKLDPQPQVLFTAAFSNLKPAASSVST